MWKVLCSSFLRKYQLFSKSIRKSEFVTTAKGEEAKGYWKGFPLHYILAVSQLVCFQGVNRNWSWFGTLGYGALQGRALLSRGTSYCAVSTKASWLSNKPPRETWHQNKVSHFLFREGDASAVCQTHSCGALTAAEILSSSYARLYDKLSQGGFWAEFRDDLYGKLAQQPPINHTPLHKCWAWNYKSFGGVKT